MLLDKKEFFKAVLLKLGIVPNDNNINFLMTWSKYELRPVGIAHGFNPLNTTYHLKSDVKQKPMKGSINNGFPVKDYSSFNNGVQATAATLSFYHYKKLLAVLKRGDSLQKAYSMPEVASELRVWGSHSFANKFKKPTAASSLFNPVIVGLILITATYLYFSFNKNYYYSPQ